MDGGVRRHGGQPAGGVQRHAAAVAAPRNGLMFWVHGFTTRRCSHEMSRLQGKHLGDD
ncbi:hypothetical protein THICB2_760043 [Thiomonas sp. CB2]|nr:hypothetical protein THICB2_760043 [Thiomonas sp. CB2]